MLQEESKTLERINQTNEMQKKEFEKFEKILSGEFGNDFIYNSDQFLINDENNLIDDIENNNNIDNNNYEEKKIHN